MKITTSLPAPASLNSSSRCSHARNPHSFDAHLAKANGAPVQAAIAALQANPTPGPPAFGHLVSAFAAGPRPDLPPVAVSEQTPVESPNDEPVFP